MATQSVPLVSGRGSVEPVGRSPAPSGGQPVPELAAAILGWSKKHAPVLDRQQRSLKQRVSTLGRDGLQQLLKEIADGSKHPIDMVDRVAAMHCIAELVSRKQLEDALGSGQPNPCKAFAARWFKEAPQYIKSAISHADDSSAFHTICYLNHEALYAALHVLDVLLTSFGISNFFQPMDEGSWEASGKYYSLAALYTMIGSCSAGLLLLLGPLTGMLVIGMSIAALFLSAYLFDRYLKPCPNYLPGATNWSRRIQQGEQTRSYGRHAYIKRINEVLKSRRGRTFGRGSKHAILVGPTGVGKTEIAKAWAQAVLRGDVPEYKGKTIFYFNTAQLANQMKEAIITRIEKKLEYHRDQAVVILDEFQSARENVKTKGILSSLLKTSLDKDGIFKHVIAMTTEEEYQKEIQSDRALARRFVRIDVHRMGREECIDFLKEKIFYEAPEIALEEGVLEYLYDQAVRAYPTDLQPQSVETLLSDCMESILEPGVTKENKELFTLGALYAREYRAFLKGVKRVNEARNNTWFSSVERETKRLAISHYFLLPVLQRALLKQAGQSEGRAWLNKGVVDRIIREKQESDSITARREVAGAAEGGRDPRFKRRNSF